MKSIPIQWIGPNIFIKTFLWRCVFIASKTAAQNRKQQTNTKQNNQKQKQMKMENKKNNKKYKVNDIITSKKIKKTQKYENLGK